MAAVNPGATGPIAWNAAARRNRCRPRAGPRTREWPNDDAEQSSAPVASQTSGREAHRGHTVPVATHRSLPQPAQHTLDELIVRVGEDDLLDIEPLNLGPDAPATAALELERGPGPDEPPDRGDQ